MCRPAGVRIVLAWHRPPDFVGGAHDFAVRLRPGVGGHLVRLNGLLRPLIKRQWADLVTRFNRDAVEESTLEEFLFGMPRRPTCTVSGSGSAAKRFSAITQRPGSHSLSLWQQARAGPMPSTAHSSQHGRRRMKAGHR